MLLIVLITLACLGVSFFCSLTEACLYSVSRSRIESLAQAGRASGARLARIRANIDEAIAAILILNTLANTGGAAWVGAEVEHRFGSLMLGAVSFALVFFVVFTVGILFFSEIVPKSLGVRFANRLAPVLSLPLAWMIWVLKPLVALCVAITRLWGQGTHLYHATEEDIINLAALGQRAGAILPQEARWIANALRLNDVTARDLMTPNSVVARVPETLTLRHTPIDAQHWRFSRIPVCRDDNPDAIVGVVYRQRVFDALVKDQFDCSMRDLMEPAGFVDENTRAHKLLSQFLAERRHLLCVRDGQGAFSGVVTLEDVIECLLGEEIVDEKDVHENMQELAKQRLRRLLKQSHDLIERRP